MLNFLTWRDSGAAEGSQVHIISRQVDIDNPKPRVYRECARVTCPVCQVEGWLTWRRGSACWSAACPLSRPGGGSCSTSCWPSQSPGSHTSPTTSPSGPSPSWRPPSPSSRWTMIRALSLLVIINSSVNNDAYLHIYIQQCLNWRTLQMIVS